MILSSVCAFAVLSPCGPINMVGSPYVLVERRGAQSTTRKCSLGSRPLEHTVLPNAGRERRVQFPFYPCVSANGRAGATTCADEPVQSRRRSSSVRAVLSDLAAPTVHEWRPAVVAHDRRATDVSSITTRKTG